MAEKAETLAVVKDAGVKLRVDPFKLSKPGVVIMGFTEHRKLGFSMGDDFELWSLNELHRYEDVGQFHRWFEIHDRKDLEGDPDHLKAMATFDIPVYMHRHWEDIPASLPFPKAEVEAKLGTYMTSSPAWMIGLAILMGAKKIAVVGIDMAQDTEYYEQRACCEYLIGIARGMGIEVIIPETSDLLKAIGQYGFDPVGKGFRAKLVERIRWLHGQDNDWLAQMRGLDQQYNALKAKMDGEYQQKREQLLANRYQVLGAIQDAEYWMRSWSVPENPVTNGPSPDRALDPRTGIAA